MKKKILFVVTYFNTGGIVRALQNFLNCYDTTLFEVDVFSMVHQGVYNGMLNNCNVLPRNKMIEASVAHLENQKGIAKIESILLKLLDKVTGYRFCNIILRQEGKNILKKVHYDAVIGFSEGLPTLMVSMMNHPNKIAWIHCDYANYIKVCTNKNESSVYDKLHKIVCVSEYTRNSFVNIYPVLKEKTIAVYNIIDDVMMREKAKECITELYDDSCFNIVSVGRIDPVKRLSIVPELARKVVDAGCKIRWYVVGPKGSDDELNRFSQNMVTYKTNNYIFTLGEKANPYPYIANADLLVNTSASEACPYVINEAKILGIPIVCTNFGSAKEYIEYGVNGYYESIENLADKIISLIKNPRSLAEIKQNLSTFNYNNKEILRTIYSII